MTDKETENDEIMENMMQKIKQDLEGLSIKEFINNVNTKSRSHLIPMEYTIGLPILHTRRGKLCVTLLYFACEGEFNKEGAKSSLKNIYPVRYVITALWPTGQIIGFTNLRYTVGSTTDFTKPVGQFPYDEVKELGWRGYNESYSALLKCYDMFIAQRGLLTSNERMKMKKLIELLMEPGLKPAYMAYGQRFFDYICGKIEGR